MLIYFIRHGQTEDNKRGIIQGQIDTPLNDQGRHEAAILAQYLKDVPFTEAYTSPLSRASETAEIVLAQHPGIALNKHAYLMERHLGSMQGHRWIRGQSKPNDAEPSDLFARRISTWFQSFLNDHTPPPSKAPTPQESTILVLSHGAYLGGLLNVLTSRSFPFRFECAPEVDPRSNCLNTSITRVRCWKVLDGGLEEGTEKWVWKGLVECWAETEHLRGIEERKVVKEVTDDVAAP